MVLRLSFLNNNQRLAKNFRLTRQKFNVRMRTAPLEVHCNYRIGPHRDIEAVNGAVWKSRISCRMFS
jgi:hypothetical protein